MHKLPGQIETTKEETKHTKLPRILSLPHDEIQSPTFPPLKTFHTLLSTPSYHPLLDSLYPPPRSPINRFLLFLPRLSNDLLIKLDKTLLRCRPGFEEPLG